jgi:hypothetical protein
MPKDAKEDAMKKSVWILLLAAVMLAACTTTPSTASPTDTPIPPTATDTPIPETTEPPADVDEPTATATATEVVPTEPVIDAEALLQDRCTACHNLDRVESASKTAEGWETTVNRMVDYGTVLTAEELEALVQYLAEMYP